MRLEEIYEIIKESDSSDFYIPNNMDQTVFVYKNDVRLSMSRVHREKTYGYEYFFDADDTKKKLSAPYDALIKALCELKNFPETYNNIHTEIWAVKYNGETVYQIDCINISNLSSLYVSLPSTLKTYDYIMNFCRICNDRVNANTTGRAEDLIKEKLAIASSLFQDFLEY